MHLRRKEDANQEYAGSKCASTRLSAKSDASIRKPQLASPNFALRLLKLEGGGLGALPQRQCSHP